MKFNLEVIIPEYREECTHGTDVYEEVKLDCHRTTGLVFIEQDTLFGDTKTIVLHEEQVKALYLHLKSVFGE